LFDSVKCETRTMRSKEDAHDYRYFPDPDLLPLEITKEFVQKLREELPELPDEKKERYVTHMGLSPYDAAVIVADKKTAEFFEEVAKGHDPKLASNWVTGELFGALKKGSHNIDDSPISAAQLSGLLDLIKDNTISGKIAKEVFAIMFETSKDAGVIVEENGLKQVTDTGAIEEIIDRILAANQDKVEQYRSGKDRLFGFFVGQTMQVSKGKANPQVVNEILKKKLAA
jgi:aspartyl-tRNA(Asn)/glutamyl-tRNA(Gln) amidotransferase subunit B